ncbi:predicted protein [Uncinocarpus reesii 1704]|uniref:LIM zinc-binding domain-containing protein n=1 Tax=Uncinocarpus reesii (strain UAMH 1704) TaxID=336963 RepID=C4JD94_UNCRE|nr:uncharacterized protein UREG_00289 [Uncinocarpus reesii 1704]EEP75443.1 predicted protein [Uncinocarpus reesii 1704]
MATGLDDFLPKIKCSNCQAEVELSAMGDHVCSTAPQPTTEEPGQSSPPRPDLSRLDGPLARVGRMAPPPPIDPLAASECPAGVIRLACVNLRQTVHFSSYVCQHLQVAFPPFPRPASRASAKNRSRSRTLVKGDRVQSPLATSPSESTADHIDSRLDQSLPALPALILSQDDQEQEEQERRRRSRANKHKREISIDSKSLYRMSVASSRYGESLSRGSTPGIPNTANLRGYHNFLDEIPPLPACPIKSVTPSPFTAAPEPYRFPSDEAYENDRVTASPPRSAGLSTGLPGFELGFPIDQEPPKPQDRHSQTARLSNGSSDFVRPEPARPDSPVASKSSAALPAYTVDQDFSVSNFARGLGLGDPYHATNNSTSSSDSSPSDTATTSSCSTQPSEPPSADIKPPPSPYKYDLDSPTDPLFQQGRFKRTPPKYERFVELPHDSEPEGLNGDTESSSSRPSSQRDHVPNKMESLVRAPAPPKSPGPRRIRCRGCGELIVGKSVSSADGRLTGRWHKACFVCYTCRSPFQTADFYVLNNNPYCGQHYHELNGSLCSSCGRGIEGPCLQAEGMVRDEKDGKEKRQLFHPDCFTCKTCRIVLKGDYLEWNGDVYCDRDGRRAAAMAYPPPSPGLRPGPSPGPGQNPGFNGPPPGYGRRPSYNSPPVAGPPRGGPGPGPGRAPAPTRGRGRGNNFSRPGNRGPGGPPPGMYPPKPNSGFPPGKPLPRGGAGGLQPPPGPRRFPERRTTKLMML